MIGARLMSLTELLNSVQIVTTQDGEKKAALLDWVVWEELLTLLEDLEDREELEQAIQEETEFIPWEQVEAEYLAANPNV
jgi:hypothetical protein